MLGRQVGPGGWTHMGLSGSSEWLGVVQITETFHIDLLLLCKDEHKCSSLQWCPPIGTQFWVQCGYDLHRVLLG